MSATSVAVCADLGSTYTKLALIDLAGGALVAAASRPTTVTTDVLIGLDEGLADLAAGRPGADLSTVLACSSAGGGLRLAVVGYEALVSAEAGSRVALTAGARVVHVASGRLDDAGSAAIRAAAPDVLLLVGGTDGGDADVLRHNADRLAADGPPVPVVVAGNADARADVVAVLGGRAVAVDNVLPRIGELRPEPARAAIREAFLRHVIGGQRLSTGPRLRSLVRAATPDSVLTAVTLLAELCGYDLLVVDVGGATTDVYSALAPPDQPDGAVTGRLGCARTVEGDLGVRAGAPGVVAAAAAERLISTAEAEALAPAAERLADGAGRAPDGLELRLAELAVVVALRRHARAERDLRRVRLVVGSGGVLRHAEPAAARAVLARATADHAGGWALPRDPALVIDTAYVLAPAGLLAGPHRAAAAALLRGQLPAAG